MRLSGCIHLGVIIDLITLPAVHCEHSTIQNTACVPTATVSAQHSAFVVIEAADHAGNEPYYDETDECENERHFDVFPQHAILELSRVSVEFARLIVQLIGFVHQQLDLLSAVQHLLNALQHPC